MIDLKGFLETDEGKKSIEDFWNKIKKENEIEKYQLKKFHSKFGDFEKFREIIRLVKSKYQSESYKNRWLNRSREPEEFLYYFLFKYAEKYGRECSKEEWSKIANFFTSEMFFINDHYFLLIHGQGTIVRIIKNTYF